MPDGFWRVTGWPEPFDPPPPPLPVGHPNLREDDAGRWDDPRGAFSTLYCASEPEGALGEKLGHFRIDPGVPRRIEAFLQSEPDSGYEDDYLLPQLDTDDIAGFGWKLAWAPSEPAAKCIDVTHWRSHHAVFRCAIPHLVEHRAPAAGSERAARRTSQPHPAARRLLSGARNPGRRNARSRRASLPKPTPAGVGVLGPVGAAATRWERGHD